MNRQTYWLTVPLIGIGLTVPVWALLWLARQAAEGAGRMTDLQLFAFVTLPLAVAVARC